MTEKKIKWIVISILIVVSAIGIFIYYEYDKRLKSSEEYIYNEALAKETSPYTLEDIQNSDAAYLLDPNFTVTEENCLQVLEDYFAAPARLFYLIELFHSNDDRKDYSCETDTCYKCDNTQINGLFGQITKDKEFVVPNPRFSTFNNRFEHYNFENDIGTIDVYPRSTGTEIIILLNEESFRIHFNEDLRKYYIAAFNDALPYSMVAWVMQ